MKSRSVFVGSSFFVLVCAMALAGCPTTPPPVGGIDTGSREDSGEPPADGGTRDGGGGGMDGGDAATIDAGQGTDDAGGLADAGTSDDGGSADASLDAHRDDDANDIVQSDSGATLMNDAGMLGCSPTVTLSGDPLGFAYDWMRCGGEQTRGDSTSWAYNLVVADYGLGFFHAASVTPGVMNQALTGTFLLPASSLPAPRVLVCSGTTSNVDLDAAGYVTAFDFEHATVLHTAGTSAPGGLVLTVGSSTTLSGDVGTHHFASTADATNGPYDAAGADMTLTLGTTFVSLVFERSGNTIVDGVIEVASGAVTDVYTFDAGTATATTITLPATLSYLGSCDGAATTGTHFLTGTVAP